jgi:hypothetical protein
VLTAAEQQQIDTAEFQRFKRLFFASKTLLQQIPTFPTARNIGNQGCQIFLNTKYQSGGKYTKL